MCALVLPYNSEADVEADVSHVQDNLDAIVAHVNDPTKILQAPWVASSHGDLSGTVTAMHSAQSVAVADTAGHFTGTNVETVLAELATEGGTLIGTSYHASTPASATVTIPANSATTAIKVIFSAYIATTGGGGVDGGCLPLNLKQGAAAAADLSVVGTRDGKFELEAAVSGVGAGIGTQQEYTMWLTAATVSGLDFTEENIVKGGTAFTTNGGGIVVSKISVTVYVY